MVLSLLTTPAMLQQEQQQAAEERRQTMLNQILQPSARERCKYTVVHTAAFADSVLPFLMRNINTDTTDQIRGDTSIHAANCVLQHACC